MGSVRSRVELGRAGEDEAARLLQGQGFEILGQNWRCLLGELDIVAARGDLVVFCEVKARRSAAWGDPSEAVDPRKQARLRRLAGRWLAEHPGTDRRIRFDVVSIVRRGARSEVEHIPDAF
jgi:putative endonuclease